MKSTITTIFETEDILGGMYVVCSQEQIIKDDGFLTTILYKVGWHVSHVQVDQPKGVGGKIKKGDQDYCLISMADGMVISIHKREEFAEFLTKGYKGQCYRLATEDEVLRVAKCSYKSKHGG